VVVVAAMIVGLVALSPSVAWTQPAGSVSARAAGSVVPGATGLGYPGAIYGDVRLRADVSARATASTLSRGFSGTPGAVADLGPIRRHSTFNCDIRSKANHRFVEAELGDTGALHGALRAQSRTVGFWEQFQCHAIGTNQWAIYAPANYRYVTAELTYTGALTGELRAQASSIRSSEKYTFVSVATCSCFALIATNSKYVSAELGYMGSTNGLLRARAASIGPWEEFAISPW
jgi:hypothetical protein